MKAKKQRSEGEKGFQAPAWAPTLARRSFGFKASSFGFRPDFDGDYGKDWGRPTGVWFPAGGPFRRKWVSCALERRGKGNLAARIAVLETAVGGRNVGVGIKDADRNIGC